MSDFGMKVTVLHNARRDPEGRTLAMMDGYQPGDPLIPVADVLVPSAGVGDWKEWIYWLLNVGDECDEPQALDYRARRNRSLSVGDVLMVDGAAVAVASLGFETVRVDPTQITRESLYGSTALS